MFWDWDSFYEILWELIFVLIKNGENANIERELRREKYVCERERAAKERECISLLAAKER